MAKANHSSKSILIVDDNEPLLRRVRALVRSFGLKDIRTASNGLDALEECKSRLPDLILLDIIMPVVNGWEVLRQLREIGPQTKVIIFSVRNDAEAGLEAARLGATDYITKSEVFETAELKIKRALAHGTPISESTTTALIRNYIEQLAGEIATAKHLDSDVAQRLKELAESSRKRPVDKKRALGALRFIEDTLSHAAGHGVGHGALRGIEKLLDLL